MRFTEPRVWMVELEDGTHQVTLNGWRISVTGFGIVRHGEGQVCVDGQPVPYQRAVGSGFLFAYLQQEWRFAIGQHAAVAKQGMAGVPIWDLWVDGRYVRQAAMNQRAAITSVAEILVALVISIAFVALLVLLVTRVSVLAAH